MTATLGLAWCAGPLRSVKTGSGFGKHAPGPTAHRWPARGPGVLPRERSVAAVLRGPQPVVDLLAGGAHGELVGVAPGHPDLAAQRDHRLARQGALEDLLLADVVRE